MLQREDIGQAFMNKFCEVYCEDSMPSGVNVSHILPSIFEQENGIMVLIPDEAEIRSVVFSMGDFKAPGPDGLLAVFYKLYWETIGREVIYMVRHFFLSGFLHQRVNATNVVLIPKVPNPLNMGQYQPISVCNVVYKVIA